MQRRQEATLLLFLKPFTALLFSLSLSHHRVQHDQDDEDDHRLTSRDMQNQNEDNRKVKVHTQNDITNQEAKQIGL